MPSIPGYQGTDCPSCPVGSVVGREPMHTSLGGVHALGEGRVDVLAIRGYGRPPCSHVADLVNDRLADIDRRLTELIRARDEFRQVRPGLEELDPADCTVDDACSAIAAAR